MNCAFHVDVENTAFCIRCGKPLCAQCVRQVQSSIYCENCLIEISGAPGTGTGPAAGTAASTGDAAVPSSATVHYTGGAGAGPFAGTAAGTGDEAVASSATVHYAGGTSPEAAFFLGLIPGVGAIYN